MGNILTYIRWRGELNFGERPFCIVDNLALAMLSYIDFRDVVSSGEKKTTLRTVYEKLAPNGITVTGACSGLPELIQLMAESRRFGNIRLSDYHSEFDDETAKQFAAVLVTLPDDSIYVAYRGTDNSIAGWQEDFCIGSKIVPSQHMAVNYLNEVAHEDTPIRIGGHSKGGNLAMYAAMHCSREIQNRLIAVYNNDGPGFCTDIVPAKMYETIEDKLSWIVPGFSVIGTLFPYKGPTIIVQSSNSAFMQHDAMSWQVEVDGFRLRDEPEKESQLFVQTFDTWISSADLQQREVFTVDFFNALRASGAKSLTELRYNGIDGYGTILMSILQSESRTKIVIGKFLTSFLHNCKNFVISGRVVYLLPKRVSSSALEKLITIGLSLYAMTLAVITLVSAGIEGTIVFIIGALAVTIGAITFIYSIYEIGKTNSAEK